MEFYAFVKLRKILQNDQVHHLVLLYTYIAFFINVAVCKMYVDTMLFKFIATSIPVTSSSVMNRLLLFNERTDLPQVFIEWYMNYCVTLERMGLINVKYYNYYLKKL